MIGYYIHHHGSGHLTRARSVMDAFHAHSPDLRVTGLSSLPRPEHWPGAWIDLPLDVAGDLPDPSAGGVLHWAPLRHRGYQDRMLALARWVDRERPRALVVDVSVEIALAARLLGVPTVVVAMRGARTDAPHRAAYDSAAHLLAPWPADLPEAWWPQAWSAKTWYVGAFSRFDDRSRDVRGPTAPASAPSRILVVWGAGGPSPDRQVAGAQAVAPGTTWLLRSPARPSPDLWSELRAADVVVTHAGTNAIAETAAARRPAVVVAADRPFGEQVATAAVLDAAHLCVGLPGWPEPAAWPDVLAEARRRGGDGWVRYADGSGAGRAAAALAAFDSGPR